MPFRIKPDLGQVSEYSVKPPRSPHQPRLTAGRFFISRALAVLGLSPEHRGNTTGF